MDSASKIVSAEEAGARARALRAAGKRLITANGAFDLFHGGHLTILEEAKAQGDVLFVGLNSDASVRANKGPHRPIVPQAWRARTVAALRCVDYVLIVDAPEAGGAIIDCVRPHVHVNGFEYGEPWQWVEYPAMRAHGVSGFRCTHLPGLSTTELIRKIQALPHESAPD